MGINERRNSEGRFPARSSGAWNALWIAAIALIYFATARFSLSFLFQPGGMASIWPPGGIFLSAILLTRRHLRPWLVGVLFLTDLVAERLAGTPLFISALYALVLSGDAVLSAWLLLRFAGEPITFRRVREVVGFLLLAVILSNALWSLVAASAARLFPTTSFWDFWKWWAASEGVGSLLVTPFILSWASLANTRLGTWNFKRLLEGAALFIPLALLNYSAFRYLSQHSVFSLLHAYITFPFLLWAALRFGVRGVSSALLLLAAIALSFAAAGRDTALSPESFHWNAIILVQFYLAILAVPSLLLAAVVTERQQSYAALQAEIAERQRTEAALHKSEGRYRLLFESNPHPMLVYDFETLAILEVNDSAMRHYGYSRQEFLAMTIKDIRPPEDIPALLGWVKQLSPGLDYSGEWRHRKKDGSIFDVEIISHEITFGGRRARLVLASDITERKRAEAVQTRLTAILEGTSDLVATATPDGKLTYMNQAGRKLLGWGAEESLEGRVIGDTHPLWALKKVEDEGLPAAAATGHWEEETALLDRHGREVPVSQVILAHSSADGVLQYFSTIMRDVTERKRAEEAQREASRLLRDVLDTVPVRVLWKDCEGRFLGCNLPFARDAGFDSPEGVIGKSDFDLPWREQAELYRADDRTVMETGLPKIGYEELQTTPTGRRSWLRTSKIPLRGAGGQIIGVLGTYEDITERKRAEEELRDREQLLSESQRIAHIGSWRWDLTGAIHWTDETYRIFGVSPKSFTLTRESFINLIHPEDRPAMQRWIEACRAGQSPSDLEFRVIFPDGSVRLLSGRGELKYDCENRPAYMAGTGQDITERKQAAEEREKALALLEASIGQSSAAILIADAPDVTIRMANAAALAIRGETDQPLTGIKLAQHSAHWQTFRPDGTPYPSEELPLARAVLKGETTRNEEVIVRNAQGQNRWVSVNAAPIRKRDGTITAGIVVFQDITERKRAEELLQSQAKHLEKLVRERTAELQENISELEAFSYTIAHDLRAPLRGILGFTQLLQRQGKEQFSEAATDYFNHIIDSARRMDHLIQDVLTLSQVTRTRLELKPVNLDKVLHGILNSYPAFQPPQVQIQVQGPLPMVMANEAALTQCLSNLLNNAVKFVAPGVMPRVEIWARQLSAPGREGLPGSLDAQPPTVPSVRVCFADNGIGIAPDQQERIFDIFQRVDTGYEGTGIGLAIVRKAMQRMGGKVGLESEPGKGSCFWLEFIQPSRIPAD